MALIAGRVWCVYDDGRNGHVRGWDVTEQIGGQLLDKALIEQNNIVENSRGNVKLGLTQSGDVTLPRNWWGTVNELEIVSTFFDHRYDESLGTVRAPEPLNGPVTSFVQ